LCIIALFVAVATGTGAQQLRDLVHVSFPARVVGVVDGDTIDVVEGKNNQKIRIRLDGIDCPESGEPFSQQARNMTRVLAFDQQVRVEGKDVDRYGRLVARIRVGTKDVSVELVSAGLACFYRKYSSDPVLSRAEANAKAGGLGFWAKSAQKLACVAREAGVVVTVPGAPVAAGKFIGNVQSKVYHAPTCPNAGCKSCTRIFSSRAEAEAAGFRPAGDCLKEP
jgi:endonuclease YncB( thermonuclease family)